MGYQEENDLLRSAVRNWFHSSTPSPSSSYSSSFTFPSSYIILNLPLEIYFTHLSFAYYVAFVACVRWEICLKARISATTVALLSLQRPPVVLPVRNPPLKHRMCRNNQIPSHHHQFHLPHLPLTGHHRRQMDSKIIMLAALAHGVHQLKALLSRWSEWK